MKKIIIILLMLVPSMCVFACLNLYVINEDGQVNYYDHKRPYEIGRMDSGYYLDMLKWYENKIPTATNVQKDRYISNYSVYLIYLGKNKEALEILQKLVKKNPNEYQILSNLGTAYELNGNLDSALYFMKASLKVYPGSHEGSEWFHISYLEASIAIRDSGVGIEGRTILKISPGYNETIANQLGMQLFERIPLTSAPNQLLSKAIEETADYFKKYVSIDWSVKFYAMALGYASTDAAKKRISGKIDKTVKRILALNQTNPTKRKLQDAVRTALLKDDRMQYIQKDVDKWKNYRSLSVNDVKLMELPDL